MDRMHPPNTGAASLVMDFTNTALIGANNLGLHAAAGRLGIALA